MHSWKRRKRRRIWRDKGTMKVGSYQSWDKNDEGNKVQEVGS